MASTALFFIMAIIAVLLLMVASIAASLGANYSFNSVFYDSDGRIRTAHHELTIAAALGWSALVVLLIILVVGFVAGGFTTNEVSELLLTKSSPTQADLLAAYKGEKELAAGHTTQVIIIIILIVIAIITLIVGILGAAAAVHIGGMKSRDSLASSAYTAAIVTAVAGIGGVGIMFIAIVTYYGIRNARAKNLAETEAFVSKIEKQLGVTPPSVK